GRGRRRRRESVEAEEGRSVERAEGHAGGAEAEGAGAAVRRRCVDDDVPLRAAVRAIALIVVAFVGDGDGDARPGRGEERGDASALFHGVLLAKDPTCGDGGAPRRSGNRP